MALAFAIVGHLKYSMFLFDGNIFVLRYFPFESHRNTACVGSTELVLVGDKDLLSIDKLFRLFCLVWGPGSWSIEKRFSKGRVTISSSSCSSSLVFVEDWHFGSGFTSGVSGKLWYRNFWRFLLEIHYLLSKWYDFFLEFSLFAEQIFTCFCEFCVLLVQGVIILLKFFE